MIEKDERFTLAERYVEETGVSVFLTGKAGTGKTTFLKEIVRQTSKRFAVVAPTGVAAINASGVTIHSFFQLPLCPYLPDVKELVTEYQMPERMRSLRKEKVKILRTLDLLIIDEISMVRADILDAVDNVLRRYRRNDKPFGGVQLLMVGDIQQLPPVVKDSEKAYMEQVYPSPFFFNSKASESGSDTYTGSRHPELVQALIAWRRERCRRDNVQAFMVLHQKTLLAIADTAPTTKEELLSIKGFGKAKCESYGDEILTIVRTSPK
jgi:hypothetical protein